MEEFRADAIVEPDAARDLLHVGADAFAQIRDLVDEGDLGGEERVRGVFGEFGGAAVGEQDRRRVEIERAIEFLHHLARALVLHADHDAVRMLEVLDRGALAQEFRIGHDGDVGVRIRLADDALDLVAGPDRHRRFRDHDGESVQLGRDLARGRVDMAEVRMPVAAPRRRSDRDEHRVGIAHRLLQRAFEGEPACLHVRGHELRQSGLEDRDDAARQRRDLVLVGIDANHLMPEIRKAGAGDEPDIACANHRHPHDEVSGCQNALRFNRLRACLTTAGKAAL